MERLSPHGRVKAAATQSIIVGGRVALCSFVSDVCVCGRQYKILNVPLSSHLAANHFNQQQAEQEERKRMKKLTLDINERQEQEDYQGVMLKPALQKFS